MKIAIIGANGFLGKKLVNFFSKENEVISASLHPLNDGVKLDAANIEEVNDFMLKFKPDLVIDTVALSSSVECEKNPLLCNKLNYLTAKNIAETCKRNNLLMVFISSSYVFDGEFGNYKEEEIPSSKNEYAQAKIMAEKEVSQLQNYLIIRFDILYGLENNKIKFGTRIFDKIVEIGFPEQMRSPVFIDDVPRIINELINKKQKGVFHIAGPDKISSLEFVKKLSLLENPIPEIKIVDSCNWILKSPKNSTLNISKINSLGIKITSIDDALNILKKELTSL